jgi:hypothetical protein
VITRSYESDFNQQRVSPRGAISETAYNPYQHVEYLGFVINDQKVKR